MLQLFTMFTGIFSVSSELGYVKYLIGLIEISISKQIVSVYQISESAHIAARNLLLISGATLWLRASNMNIYIGIIRSGGDTKFGLITEMMTIWLIGVPLALLGAFVLHLSAPIVYAMITLEEATKLIIGFRRFRSGKWINILVNPPLSTELV